MLDPNDPFVQLPDICSYNLYYGWYLGELQQNDEFFDTFHKNHPDRVIGLSEFGADANPAYQSARPERGDWSESYQAVYHEHMLKCGRSALTSGRCTSGTGSTSARTVAVRAASPVKTRRVL